MFELLTHLSTGTLFLLGISLFLILFFEFINGFHDTANAVATVIYTQAMKPIHSVMLSGLFNFLGVITGGLAVAYSIVYLLPIELLASGNSAHVIAMIFCILIGAIIWNLGTWYFGLPASSSHTLIGAIIGVGMIHALLTSGDFTTGVNWGKAYGVFSSLLFSPFAGFVLAFFMLIWVKRLLPKGSIHQSPYLRSGVIGKRKPPFWTRFLLILSAAGVSFAHGSNDGQKGVGLVMLALICILPSYFAINIHTNRYYLERTVVASQQLHHFTEENQQWIKQNLSQIKSQESNTSQCHFTDIGAISKQMEQTINKHPTIAQLSDSERWHLRSQLMCLDSLAKNILTVLPTHEEDKVHYIQSIRNDFKKPVEYAPWWVIVAIASALCLGTMVGWKRVVKTVGEGIGKSHMTYAQGVCAQLTAALGIAAANLMGLPVSTTQILSSAVAGTAVANKSGLKAATIKYIALAWLFTFPVAMILSGGLYYIVAMFL